MDERLDQKSQSTDQPQQPAPAQDPRAEGLPPGGKIFSSAVQTENVGGRHVWLWVVISVIGIVGAAAALLIWVSMRDEKVSEPVGVEQTIQTRDPVSVVDAALVELNGEIEDLEADTGFEEVFESSRPFEL